MINMDRLYEAVAACGQVCVGLDTAPDYLPSLERRQATSDAEAILRFNSAIIEATYDVCACYKVQIAYYEALGLAGLRSYAKTLDYIRSRDKLVIADIKRGDIADTASRYAKAHFEGDFAADFVTLTPYLGFDSIEPWFHYARDQGKGAFVLLRTSNPGWHDFQALQSIDGSRLYNHVGNRLSQLAEQLLGIHAYGAFGAVVGCTETEEATEIRNLYKNLFFLIPGYGAQGGTAKDVAKLLQNGNGGVVNVSRSILKAWTTAAIPTQPKEAVSFTEAAAAARQAAIEIRTAIRGAVR